MCRGQMGTFGLNGVVDVKGEGIPMLEDFEIGPRVSPWCRLGSAVESRIEQCISVICKREIWEAGYHCEDLVGKLADRL